MSDEVKHYKEMCANYEQQLQRTQRQMTQEMAEKEEAVESIMDTVEKHKVSIEQEKNGNGVWECSLEIRMENLFN